MKGIHIQQETNPTNILTSHLAERIHTLEKISMCLQSKNP